MNFTEAKLEQAFIELLESEYYLHFTGDSIVRAADEVLIEEDLLHYLLSRYEHQQLTETEARTIILKLKNLPASDLYESNKTIQRWLSDGFILKREDRNQKDIHIELIDYKRLENAACRDAVRHVSTEYAIAAEPTVPYGVNYNIYKFVNQLEIVGTEKRIPDGIIYINGLPIVVFEFKSAIREEATIHDAYVQLTTRYKRDIPELFKYNAFCVISDGVNNKAGSFFAPYEFFYAWRRIAGMPKDTNGINSMFTLVRGMLNQNQLRDIIRNFIYIPDTSKKNEKIVCRYPQYYAAKRLYDSIKTAQRPLGDGKGGTYFGATGCGKSYTMLYLTRLLMRSLYFESPTIVLITDRTDLDDQLSRQFTNAKQFIGDNNIVSVESREHLRELLQSRQSGGVFLSTIHKFTEDTRLLSERNNVICISDEAHRSQINLDQKIKITEKGVAKTFGFAKYLHDSLPNAVFVGFTGTPIDATLDVFGQVVDAYTMTESVEDEITVRIVYEGRAAKVALNNSELEKIERYYEQAAEAGTNEYQIEKSKEETTQMNAILGDPKRLQTLAEDFVKHYENRISEGATVCGKALFVCSRREIAYEFYKNVIALLGKRSSSFVENKEIFVDFNNAKQELCTSQNFSQFFTTKFGHPEEWHDRNLPHRNKEGLIQSITFRLADSLPQNVLKQIELELKTCTDSEKDIQKRAKYEKWLDNGLGCCALAHPEMAQVMQDALKYHDGDKYDLLAWCIMPNHVHVLIKTKSDLSRIVQSWKSFTGKWALANNKKFNLGIPEDASKFWMEEYWDRFIRDENHFNNTVNYILENPKKANLPEKWLGCTLGDAKFPLGNAKLPLCSNKTKQELHPSQQELHPSQIKMIMTRGKDDDETLYALLGTKEYRKTLDTEFKNEKSNFKIAIVVDMWLTGFDVPFLDTIYIDKPIQQHNLIQTISRVNRKFEGKNKGLVVDYIGIKKQMNLALAKYNKGDEDNFEDIAQSLVVVQNHLDLLAKIFHKFDNTQYFAGNALEQLTTLNMAAEFVQQTKEIETRFMGLVKRLKAAYDICAGSEQLTQQERDYTHFYLAVRSIVFKLTKGDAPDTAQMNARVREMIKDALASDGVEEIFKMGDENESEQDLFDEDYLEKINKIKLPNTKIKLLQQLLAKVIGEIKKVNKVKGVDFSKKMQSLVERYNQRDESDVLRSEVYEEMAEQLTNLIWEVRKEFSAGDELGIGFEEKAFYDILQELCIKYDFKYPDNKMIELAKAVKELVDSQTKFPDWSKRDDIKSSLKVGLILLLDEFGYPPVERDEVYVEIFEQAENFKKNRTA
ncbi:MAG: Type-1 restriction enzyme R protein [Candidatus Ordinivivax streblomastigis]|uniref:Type I restriction enzyme endonuclease subunit n=1 Tax=Candidatus Ordinivivax streblomastigis TaxID=2540710 RepID=A0A5M8P1R7_9BACT|nr:MAG: Type-1 restriction enzyme R protein [Candidatus Ordinivivax streblomastigis]